MTEVITHWIDGGPVLPQGGRRGQVFDPATGVLRAEVDLADAGVVDRAVVAARDAAQVWRATSLSRRTQVLFAFRELLNARKEELAAIITAEHG